MAAKPLKWVLDRKYGGTEIHKARYRSGTIVKTTTKTRGKLSRTYRPFHPNGRTNYDYSSLQEAKDKINKWIRKGTK